MAIGYHDGSRSLQDHFDTRALADRIDDLLVAETISDYDRAFIEALDLFFLATADAEGRPTCSYKGGCPASSGCWMGTPLRSPTTTATACTSPPATCW